jgi:prepilin-type N-terminal cleavage/methylation domain-containing protein
MVKAGKKICGLTLAEIMVVVVIMGMIMTGINYFFSSGLKFFRINQAKMETQRDARRCLGLINKKLREAKRSTIVVNKYDNNQPPWSSIQFNTADNDNLMFYQKGTKLYMKNLNRGSDQMIAENLRHVTFCYPNLPNNQIISISICFEMWTRTPTSRSLQLSVEKVRIMND